MVLYTDRLKLRLVEPRDAEPMERLINDKEIARTTLGIPHPYPPGSADAFIQRRQEAADKGEGFSFAVLDRPSGTFMGIVGLRIDPAHHHAELAYWLGRAYWNKGYCSEAAKRVLQFAWEDLKLHRVWAAAMTRNPASFRVMEKMGMKHEGVFRGHVLKDGTYEDLTYYALLRSELS
ncbi:GNAT family N-acetyltransferase [Cohnella ginsengisoli]|uniref:GNAT family N-acetyltransferase n=1 Tax=Cohnella ginsengisoli TaxID=425004 RepID=A0A9X4KJ19_9BACL|nr:GNAT family N-acetyltransferase [Cohnella ginsengisoli]MDG0792983.1 GNAT family N-acetyltransferase [Cohnella ginsengisoli]